MKMCTCIGNAKHGTERFLFSRRSRRSVEECYVSSKTKKLAANKNATRASVVQSTGLVIKGPLRSNHALPFLLSHRRQSRRHTALRGRAIDPPPPRMRGVWPSLHHLRASGRSHAHDREKGFAARTVRSREDSHGTAQSLRQASRLGSPHRPSHRRDRTYVARPRRQRDSLLENWRRRAVPVA